MELENVVADLVERVERRLYGKYRGLVVDNADPELLGRLKVRVPSVLGNEVVTGWALPCLPYGGAHDQGMLFVPEVGAGVWVEFEEGDPEFPVWVGTFWSQPEGESELPKPNDPDGTEQNAVQDPPTRKIIKTKKGHTLQFEDADGEEMVTLFEAVNEHVVVMNQDGIKITDGANGHVVELAGSGIKITEGKKSHEIELVSSGIKITDGANSGNEILMDAQGITCQDKNGNTITMDASSGHPAGPGIDLNGGERVCLKGLVDWLLTHQHTGNLGGPTPVFPADLIILQTKINVPGGGILSDTVKAK